MKDVQVPGFILGWLLTVFWELRVFSEGQTWSAEEGASSFSRSLSYRLHSWVGDWMCREPEVWRGNEIWIEQEQQIQLPRVVNPGTIRVGAFTVHIVSSSGLLGLFFI